MSRGPKKSAAARRTSHASRGAVRAGAPAAKMAGSRKGAGEGVLPGMPTNKKTTQRQGFKTNEFIVYPAHGVGQILAIEEQEIAGRQARAVRHQLRQGQDDAAGSDRQDRVGRHAQAGRSRRWSSARSRRSRAARASSAPCGRAGRRNTKPRSIPATSSPSPRWCATCTGRTPSRSSPIPSGSFTKPRSTGCRARSRRCRRSPRPKRSRRSKAALAKGPRRGPKPADEADAEPATEEEAA